MAALVAVREWPCHIGLTVNVVNYASILGQIEAMHCQLLSMQGVLNVLSGMHLCLFVLRV